MICTCKPGVPCQVKVKGHLRGLALCRYCIMSGTGRRAQGAGRRAQGAGRRAQGKGQGARGKGQGKGKGKFRGNGQVGRTHYIAQFSNRNPGTRSNSRVLLVTRIVPMASAWAAIIVSRVPIG